MSKYTISRNDGEPIGMDTTKLDFEAVFGFLESVDPYFYLVEEYSEDDQLAERMNGQEWLDVYLPDR